MDIISTMMYETSIRATIKNEVEQYVRGTCKVWLDRQNDSIKVSILDKRNKPWTYEEYNLQEKLSRGVNSLEISHNAVRAYERKIFKEYFK